MVARSSGTVIGAILLVHCAGDAIAFSGLSSFTRSTGVGNPYAKQHVTTSAVATNNQFASNGQTWTMYGDEEGKDKFNAWSVLSTTEKWISATLSSMNKAAAAATGKSDDPYKRKEVSYACETYNDTPMIAAGIFRRIKELRQVGEEHGRDQHEDMKALTDRQREEYNPPTLRQTQVVVIPGSKVMTDRFDLFDALVQRINNARRNARDYVTDVMLDKRDADNAELDWSISVSCAHMHPKFGEKSPEQILAEMKKEEEDGEVDLNYKAYQERKMKARQSPYPTIALEMRAMPSMDFGNARPESSATQQQQQSAPNDPDDSVTSDDVQKLEALFGKSAAVEGADSKKSALHAALSETLEEVSSQTPMERAQNWVSQNDPALQSTTFLPNNVVASFTETSDPHVDAAYEFVFINLAMVLASESSKEAADASKIRQYLVMPKFLSSAATSMEKFKMEVEAIWQGWPDLEGKDVSLEVFHPEHIDADKRAPVPIFVIQLAKKY